MRKLLVSVFAAVSVFGLAGATPASAAETVGDVVAFSQEFSELRVYENPSGCHALPIDVHQLNNRTDETITVYGDPLCMVPTLKVQPGYGTHVPPGSGSFSVGS